MKTLYAVAIATLAFSAPAAADWRESVAPIGQGWTCYIEHKTNLPDEMLCNPPTIVRFMNHMKYLHHTPRDCRRYDDVEA